MTGAGAECELSPGLCVCVCVCVCVYMYVWVHAHFRLYIKEERDRKWCIPDVLEMRWVSLERNTFPGMFAERNSSASIEHVLPPPPLPTQEGMHPLPLFVFFFAP